MCIRRDIAAVLCVGAGLLLSGDAVLKFVMKEQPDFDIFAFAVGVYFIGKGLFIRQLMTFLREYQNR